MHVVAPKGVSTSRSNGPQGEWVEKPVTTSLGLVASEENFTDGGGGRLLSRGSTKQCPFVVQREEEIQEWIEQKLPKVLPGYSGGKLPREERAQKKETEKKRRKRRTAERDL